MAVASKRPLHLSLIFAVLLVPGLARAGHTLYIRTTGTSTAAGTITIESFSKPSFPNGPGKLSPETLESAVVNIPSGSTAINTTMLVRDAIDTQMSGNYVP